MYVMMMDQMTMAKSEKLKLRNSLRKKNQKLKTHLEQY